MTGTRGPTCFVVPAFVRPMMRYQTMQPSGASTSRKASAQVVPMRMPTMSPSSVVR